MRTIKTTPLWRSGKAFTLILASIALASCGHSDTVAAGADSTPSPAPPVQFVAVRQQTIRDFLDLPAKIQADPTKVIRVFPPTSGRVVSVEVKPGDHVRRGTTLVVIQSSDVASALSDYQKSQIEADRSARVLARETELFQHGAAAEKDYQDAKAQAESANAELDRAAQRLRLLNVSAQSNTDRVQMKAPSSGEVLDVVAAPGQFAKSLESSDPLLTIANLDPIWVVGDVYEKDVSKLAVGRPATVTVSAYPEQQWNGRIAALSDALDPVTRTLKVRIVLTNPHNGLKPEMFASIHVEVGSYTGLVVPAESVIREGNTSTVFVQDKSGKIERRTIATGRTFVDKVEITSGLRPGDLVASHGAELLKGSPAE